MLASFLKYLKQILWVVRFRSIDTSTAEGRAKERYRRVVLTTLASLGAKGITIVTSIITVPLTLQYLGPERYGLWVTISSVIALLAFADLGMGNGLLNAISAAHGRDDRVAAVKAISNAVLPLTCFACAMFTAFAALYNWIPWEKFFNLTSPVMAGEVGPTMIVLVGCFAASLPLGMVEKVQRGYQEGFEGSLWLGIGNLLALGAVLLVISLRGGLPWLALAIAGTPPLAALLNGLILFGVRYPWLRPSRETIDLLAMRDLLQTGLVYLVLQAAAVFAFASDNFVIARVLGTAAVTEYSISVALFSIVPLTLNTMLMPLWPAYGEAVARGDTVWVKNTFKRSLILTLIYSLLACGLLIVVGTRLIHLWVGASVTPSLSLLIALGAWTIIFALHGALTTFLNGIAALRLQLISTLVLVPFAIIGKAFLGTLIGLQGIALGMILSYILCSAIPYGLFVPKILAGINRSVATPLIGADQSPVLEPHGAALTKKGNI